MKREVPSILLLCNSCPLILHDLSLKPLSEVALLPASGLGAPSITHKLTPTFFPSTKLKTHQGPSMMSRHQQVYDPAMQALEEAAAEKADQAREEAIQMLNNIIADCDKWLLANSEVPESDRRPLWIMRTSSTTLVKSRPRQMDQQMFQLFKVLTRCTPPRGICSTTHNVP